ncbi:glycosylphosphatidylinositol anchored cell wall protein [Stemphylium lycopersici]|uniref:Glycosylphosphatidylinositol anchored cell wall protein n=1 Tax=Stemphylium lycopersici TaxID=183478 RepID=A0A364NBL1_STELY|nr:glycosylphosphatidylinositol anchored cell wall protein [Stemphylium lycopersici]
MLGRTIFAATFFALAQFAAASPPACLLGAVNQYDYPVDVQSVCKAKGLSARVVEMCGDDAEAAMEALTDICNGDVEMSTTVASASMTGTGSPYKPTGYSASTMVPMYPTGTVSNGGGNGTAPIATGGPKPPSSATDSAGIPEATGAAGKVKFSFAAAVAGILVAAL